MLTLDQYLHQYALSHQNPLNQVIHLICVPAIFFATLGLLWLLPLGRWLLPESPAAGWINGATVLMLPAGLFYLRLSAASLLTGAAWTGLSVLAIVAIERAGLSLAWVCGTVWVLAWAVQFYGHHVEGAKPSFADDLMFLLIGPLFVQHKLHRLLTTGSLRPRVQ